MKILDPENNSSDDISDKVSFIDYEYADTNYNLFDIANHFNEYAGMFRSSSNWTPRFISGVEDTDYTLCPSSEDKKVSLRSPLTTIPMFTTSSHP